MVYGLLWKLLRESNVKYLNPALGWNKEEGWLTKLLDIINYTKKYYFKYFNFYIRNYLSVGLKYTNISILYLASLNEWILFMCICAGYDMK